MSIYYFRILFLKNLYISISLFPTMPKREFNLIKKEYKQTGGAIYGLGFLGAAIYYIQQATGFWEGVVGVLKAIVWPAFVVYKLLGL